MTNLDSLPVYRYAVRLKFEESLDVPPQGRGVLWRGAFGVVYRKLVCHDLALDCKECVLRSACPYPAIFHPELTRPELPIARLREPPRPFVLVDPLPEALTLPAKVPVDLGLTVVGRAFELLPHFAATLMRLGEEGIGRKGVRFGVESIHALDRDGLPRDEVYCRGGGGLKPVSIALTADGLRQSGDERAKRVAVRFLTPTLLRSQGKAQNEPSFGVLLRRLRDRISAFTTTFADEPLDIDARGLGERADTIATVHADCSRIGWTRTSARTRHRHSIEGIVGQIIYEGDALPEFLPWLRLGEVLHVGKHASFGNGKIEVKTMG